MTVVTFGVASSAFHAIRALQNVSQFAKKELAEIICRDFYVDDLLTGARSVQEARRLIKDLTDFLAKYGFPLRKWASSEKGIIRELPVELRESENAFCFGDTEESDHVVFTLGAGWNTSDDTLT